MIAVCVRITFPLLYAVRDVVATLFNERGRVVLSSCHAVLHGRLVDLEWMRKLEIQDVRQIRKEINYLRLRDSINAQFINDCARTQFTYVLMRFSRKCERTATISRFQTSASTFED